MRRIVVAGGAALLSVGLTASYAAHRVAYAQTMATAPAHASPPAAMLALLGQAEPPVVPTTPALRRRVATLLMRDPISQSAYNLWYVAELTRPGVAPQTLATDANLLGRLGWRDTAALQNLIFRKLVTDDPEGLMDLVDALLRRQKLVPQSMALMEAVEQFPQSRRFLLRKLLSNVPWRDALLMDGANNRTPAFQTGRIQTLLALRRAGQRFQRSDVDSFVGALVASGRTAEAARLWTLYAGTPPPGSALRDPNFAAARLLADQAGAPGPFEWTFASGIGFSATPTRDEGLAIDWDGQGAPLFASQTIAPAGGLPRTLVVQSGTGRLDDVLRFTLSCGGSELEFLPGTVSGDTQRFTLEPGSLDCAAPVFAISGRPDIGSRSVDVALRQVLLR